MGRHEEGPFLAEGGVSEVDPRSGSFVRVAVPVPLLPSLVYRVPDGTMLPARGARVRVPLGSRVVTGCVISVHHHSRSSNERHSFDDSIKELVDHLDEETFLPGPVIDLALWVSEYYACGPGDAIGAAMPPYSWTRKGRVMPLQSAFKSERFVQLTKRGRLVIEDGDSTGFGSRQKQALTVLTTEAVGMTTRRLAQCGVSLDTLRRLSTRGLVEIAMRRCERDPFYQNHAREGEIVQNQVRKLTSNQEDALTSLSRMARDKRFRVAMLHGVTGSGKTELYLRLATLVNRQSRRALVLVPEIALAPALAERFRSVFGDRVAIQHSGLTAGERHDQWHRIRRGEVDVVVGTRSAVFAPLDGLGLIVVDEEHDASYKQDESPRYHGRDAAIVRGRQANVLVVLGSATPSMETFNNAKIGKYERVVLPQRVFQRPLPDVKVIDMRHELAATGPATVISNDLARGLEDRLRRKQQSLLLLNRRGFSTSVMCRQCGQLLECPNCSVTLTFHRGVDQVRCHYCNYSKSRPSQCSNCASPFLEQIGFGTEQIESEVKRLLPDARVSRLDRDTVRRKGAVTRILSDFGGGEVDILIGTQMVAKGHDFPAVTLVGVISADVGLGLADFRAAERTFQLLTQVAGRSGRGELPGEAIIQTFFPDHYSIGFSCRQEYERFFNAEMKFRHSMRYPPVVAMINVLVRAGRYETAMGDATVLAKALRRNRGFDVLGPAPAALPKLRGEHRVQMFLKGTDRPVMRGAVQEVLSRYPRLQRRVTVDVDPLNVL